MSSESLPRAAMSTSSLSRPALLPLGLLALGLASLLLPTYWKLAHTLWNSDDQGHGPIILAVSFFLMWRMREALAALPYRPANGAGGAVLAVALLCYVVGHSQEIIQLEAGSHLLLWIAVALLARGPAALRMAWFPIFFLVFMVPLPGVFVQMLTVPLKSAVSHVVESLLYHLNYPIARTGVVLNIGPYQLLVADACAGLNSMFTLEALGLLYMNLMGYTSRLRNVLLAVLIIPISFGANIVRVLILVLVTYYFGDAAGQGFIHGFAGMVLFIVGLVLMLIVDNLLGWVLKKAGKA
jgi:exosortase B